MKVKRTLLRLVLASPILLIFGCGLSTQTSDIAPSVAEVSGAVRLADTSPSADDGPPVGLDVSAREPYRFRPGDTVEISVWGIDEMTRTVPLGPDGMLSYILVGRIRAQGRTAEEIGAEIEDRLKRYVRNPQVTVIGKEFAGNYAVVLGGGINDPGLKQIRNDTTLGALLAMAGGLKVSGGVSNPIDLADLNNSFLARDGRLLDLDLSALLKGDMSQDVLVRPSDFLYVPSSVSAENKIFVVGQVKTPKVVRYNNSITFVEAVMEAGGPTSDAWERQAFVVGGSLREPVVTEVNARSVLTGHEKNFYLKQGDIVFVPMHPLGKIRQVMDQLGPLYSRVIETDNMVHRWEH